MRIGFTGTRAGMTEAQKKSFTDLIMRLDYIELHHGDCIGADAEAHAIALQHPRHSIIIHPPIDERHRAHCQGADVIKPAKTHFARNRDIVMDTEQTVGCPYQQQEPDPPNGGTWYTLNYSEAEEHPTHTIWPDGDVLSYGGAAGIKCPCLACQEAM